MNYYERHIGDYLKDTAHLSLLEHGIYTRLLDVYYTREGGIPASDAARLIGARTRDERTALVAVLGEFFVLRDGAHVQDRCEREIQRYADKQAKAKASADARWSAQRSLSDRNANASAKHVQPACEGNAPRARPQSPDTKHQPSSKATGGEPAPSAAPPTPPPDFDGKNAETLNGKAVVPIAAGFELPESWGFDAEALGFKPPDVLREGEKFRQYWTAGRGAGTRRSVKGWRQTWSNWLEKAAKDAR